MRVRSGLRSWTSFGWWPGGPCCAGADDVQWLDPSSQGAAGGCGGCAEEGGCAGDGAAPETGVPFALERVFPEERLTSLSLGPLGGAELQRLLRERLGLELAPSELARVREATAGNPFLRLSWGGSWCGRARGRRRVRRCRFRRACVSSRRSSGGAAGGDAGCAGAGGGACPPEPSWWPRRTATGRVSLWRWRRLCGRACSSWMARGFVCASVAGLDLLRAGTLVEAPCGPPSPRRGSRGCGGARPPPGWAPMGLGGGCC